MQKKRKRELRKVLGEQTTKWDYTIKILNTFWQVLSEKTRKKKFIESRRQDDRASWVRWKKRVSHKGKHSKFVQVDVMCPLWELCCWLLHLSPARCHAKCPGPTRPRHTSATCICVFYYVRTREPCEIPISIYTVLKFNANLSKFDEKEPMKYSWRIK